MSINYRELRVPLRIDDVLSWMSRAASRRVGGLLRAPCLFCVRDIPPGSPPSFPRTFSVNVERHIFCCCKNLAAATPWTYGASIANCRSTPPPARSRIACTRTSNRKTAPDGPQIKQPRHRPPPLNWLNLNLLSTKRIVISGRVACERKLAP